MFIIVIANTLHL